MGALTVSVTVGRPEKRSTGLFVRVIPDEPGYVLLSVTTGTCLRTTLEPAEPCPARLAAFATCSGGSGARRCTLGTRSSGNPALGSVSVVSGVVGPGNAGWRSAAAIGPT